MDENQNAGNGIGVVLQYAGISRASAYYIGIGLAVIALVALAAGAYYYLSPAAPAEIAVPPTETTESNISEASENPAENIPETNPFKKASNPFDSYTNPFE